VQALQLIWTPRFEALVRVTFNELSRDFKMEWNAVNGRGIYGSCKECGSTIENLEGGVFCYTCGNMYCASHLEDMQRLWKGCLLGARLEVPRTAARSSASMSQPTHAQSAPRRYAMNAFASA